MNAAGGIDFNDFISKTVELFSKHGDALQKYQKIFKYVLVDEFQDISSMQWELLKQLTGQSGQITAVGDVDQVCLRK
jgi:superfamily I DNA/RNA helicase